MEIGKYIKQLRNERGISQEELGKIIGVQRAAVQKWESGITKNLKRATIQKLAEYFNVNPANFVDEDSTDEPNPINLDKELEGVRFALYTETEELTDDDKQAVLDFVRFLKSKNKKEE